MYFTGKLRLFAALIASAAIASGTLLSCLPQQQAPLQPHALPQQNDADRCPLAKPPRDVPPLDVVGIPPEVCQLYQTKDFADMAWQTFKTLVWPAAERGYHDGKRKIDDMNGSRVFETYKADWETFLDKAAQPDEWQVYPKKAPVCANADTMTPPFDKNSLVLASLHKFGNLDLPYDVGPPALLHLLVSQKGSLVRYLTGFGEQTFNTIRNNELYKPQIVVPTDDPPMEPRYFKPGAINVKSAWIEIDPENPETADFYKREAWVQNPHKDVEKRTCRRAWVALVALHIAHKTQVNPQWIWASFEHVRNVPESDKKLPDGISYTFNDGKGINPMKPVPPPEAQLSYFEDHPFEIPKAFNVERQKKIPKAIRDINASWQKELKGTVWKNYELVMVQWPELKNSPTRTGADGDTPAGKRTATPVPPCGTFAPKSSVANSVIETFLQLDTDCGKDMTCMSCHNRTRNYDFVWSIWMNDKESSKAAISVLRQNMWGQRQ